MARLVTRAEWNAKPPTGQTPWDWSIVKGLAIHHSVTPEPAEHKDCAKSVLGIQAFQMGNGYRDVAYSAIVCPHGFVFEGRWLNDRTGANGTAEANDQYFAVCFLGTSPKVTYERAQALRFIRRTIRMKNADARQVKPHSDFVPTACPGKPLQNWIEAGGPRVNCRRLAAREKALVGRISALQEQLKKVRARRRLGRCEP